MKEFFHRHLRNTHSSFWRIYENASALLFLMMALSVAAWVWSTFGNTGGHSTSFPEWTTWLGRNFSQPIMVIIAVDFIKYALTGSARDLPIRKWFSFRWAQKFKPHELIVVPKNYEGDKTDLVMQRCNRCGALHGFYPTATEVRACSVYGCKEVITPPQWPGNNSSNEAALQSKVPAENNAQTSREPISVFDEIDSTPLRWILKHAWVIADHAFKLTTWMIGASALLAFGVGLGNLYIIAFVVGLMILWIVALVSILFKVICYFQDVGHDRWIRDKSYHPVFKILFGALMTALIVIPTQYVFFGMLNIFMTFLTHGGIPR